MSSAQQDLVDAAINVDQEAVVAPAAETPLNRLNERLIRVVNKCPWSLSFQAESKENDSGWRVLAPGQCYAFSFTPKSDARSHYWGKVKSNSGRITFPLFNEGAPLDDNLFEIWPDKVYLEGRLSLTQIYAIHVVVFGVLFALSYF